jgi:hypothetical protein
MAKAPQVGSTKTRLCPPLRPYQAAAVYEAMLLDTIDLGAQLEGIDLAIAITPPESKSYFRRISPPGTQLLPVVCKDIGNCLSQSLAQALGRGYQKVCALNADGPSLPPGVLKMAFGALDGHDLVIGPGVDGGYYLIGLTRIYPRLFIGIDWSTPAVMDQTHTIIENLGLTVSILPTWYDIDTVDELLRLVEELKTLPSDRLPHTRRVLDDPEIQAAIKGSSGGEPWDPGQHREAPGR